MIFDTGKPTVNQVWARRMKDGINGGQVHIYAGRLATPKRGFTAREIIGWIIIGLTFLVGCPVVATFMRG